MQRAEKSIRVAAPVGEVYAFWRDFEHLPRFMENVKEVSRVGSDGAVWHWKLKGPLNSGIEYDARVTEDQPNKSIGWNATGGQMNTTGVVTFTDLQDNTEVHVVMQWADPPGGALGEKVSTLLQDPDQMLGEDLLRFKYLMERRSPSAIQTEDVHSEERIRP